MKLSAGYTVSYSGHSFRIGAATTAADRRVADHLIKTLGRWSSDAYQIYISTPVSSIVHVSRQLVAQRYLHCLKGCRGVWCLRFEPAGPGALYPNWLPRVSYMAVRSARRRGRGGELVAGWRVGRPVGVLPHWGVIAVASH